MTLLEIEAYLAIVRCGTISTAAKELFVSQPALSRRLKALENELGYELFIRKKGIQIVQLTEEGKAFLPIADKWQRLWSETNAIRISNQRPLLKMASVGSVSTYFLPEIFHAFLREKKYNLEFRFDHSQGAYSQVEGGFIDIAFITNPMFSKTVQTIPLFSEPFMLVSHQKYNVREGRIPAQELKAENEIRLPWNQEYDAWHRLNFDESVYPNVLLDQMSLMEEFLMGDNWAIVPWSVSKKLAEKGVYVYPLKDGPPDRVIYYLIKSDEKKEMIDFLLRQIHDYIQELGVMQSLLFFH